MATFSIVPREEAQRATMPPRRAAHEEYRAYLRQLGPDVAGRIELDEGEHSLTARARLKAAAKAEGIGLDIRRRGNVLTFWQTDLPAPQSQKSQNRRRRS